MASDTVPALVLDDPAVSHSEPVHFSGFPGVWAPDHAVAVRELGFDSEEEALARARDLGLPLKETTVAADATSTLLPRDNWMPGLDEVRNTGWTPAPGQPGAVLAAGEAFPADPPVAVETVAERLASPLDVNVDEALGVVAATPAVELDALELAESDGRNRSSVLAAIAARRDELTATREPEGEV